MKTTKLILAAALIGTASLSAAHAGVHFGFSFGLPLPVPVVVAAPAPVVVAPAPVYYAPPTVYSAPGPVVVAQPACPGPDYVWTAGYWNTVGYSRVWVPGCWNYRPAHVVYARGYDHGYAPVYAHGGYGWHR